MRRYASARRRSVNEIPASAAAAVAAVTPGMISNGTPAARTAAISSARRPKIAGSPPFKRATFRRRRARSTRSQLISDWPMQWRRGALPTSMISAPAATSSRRASGTSRSWTMTSASRSRRSAFTVMRSGSPGPAPMNETKPLIRPGPPRAPLAERTCADARAPRAARRTARLRGCARRPGAALHRVRPRRREHRPRSCRRP